VLLLAVVLWVWANTEEATPKPKMATMAPTESNVFINDIGFGSILREPTQKNRHNSFLRMLKTT
jgi:hypothetical protein